uniref:Uncharacterized protein n=1 Tax=Ciona savignyi TaxID=51511 RepID=H2YGE7_CIOSA
MTGHQQTNQNAQLYPTPMLWLSLKLDHKIEIAFNDVILEPVSQSCYCNRYSIDYEKRINNGRDIFILSTRDWPPSLYEYHSLSCSDVIIYLELMTLLNIVVSFAWYLSFILIVRKSRRRKNILLLTSTDYRMLHSDVHDVL